MYNIISVDHLTCKKPSIPLTGGYRHPELQFARNDLTVLYYYVQYAFCAKCFFLVIRIIYSIYIQYRIRHI